MVVKTNGDLLFEPGELIPVLSLYRPTDSSGLHFTPKYNESCVYRAFTGGLSPCARTLVFKWQCSYFKKQVSPTICNDCKVAKDGK